MPQDEFTKATPETIPTLAVVEEAQSVLGSGGGGGEGPYVAWVKEGRKYDLGAVLITQQPGSISQEILSQGDNWFIFHLLSSGDLTSVKKVNAHFSDDILSTLLNEPIPGHGVFWSGAGGKSYPIPLRVLSFEQAYKARDPQYNLPRAKTFAEDLRKRFKAAVTASQAALPAGRNVATVGHASTVFDHFNNNDAELITDDSGEEVVDNPVDVMRAYADAAIAKVKSDSAWIDRIRTRGMHWRGIIEKIAKALPDLLDNRKDEANKLVPRFLNETFGDRGRAWETRNQPSQSGSGTTCWVHILQ